MLAVVIFVAAAIGRLAAPVASRGPIVLLRRVGVILLWAVWMWYAWESQADSHCSRRLVLDKARPVACLGNSLTSGVPPYGGYPDDLAERLSVPVVNRGEAGITAEQALSSLPDLFSPCAPPGMWMKDDHLSDDGLHPNASGNVHLASQAAHALCRMYGSEIMSN